MTCCLSSWLEATVPAGRDRAGTPARLAGTVMMSFPYIAEGLLSEVRSRIGGEGAVGVNKTSTLLQTSRKSRLILHKKQMRTVMGKKYETQQTQHVTHDIYKTSTINTSHLTKRIHITYKIYTTLKIRHTAYATHHT